MNQNDYANGMIRPAKGFFPKQVYKSWYVQSVKVSKLRVEATETGSCEPLTYC